MTDTNTHTDTTPEADENGYYGPSKSQRKRDMHALQELGEQLLTLSNARLNQLQLNDNLLEAVKEAQQSQAREGKRRLLQYIGKLMRFENAEAIRNQLMRWENGTKEQAADLHRIEALREVLLRDDNALTEFFNTFPHANPQSFRTVVRNARREAKQNETLIAANKEPVRKQYRQLYQAIKALLEHDSTKSTE